jgi:hypothetical protein
MGNRKRRKELGQLKGKPCPKGGGVWINPFPGGYIKWGSRTSRGHIWLPYHQYERGFSAFAMVVVGGSGLSVRKSPRRIDVFPFSYLVRRLLGGQNVTKNRFLLLLTWSKFRKSNMLQAHILRMYRLTVDEESKQWPFSKQVHRFLQYNVSRFFLLRLFSPSPFCACTWHTTRDMCIHARLQWHIMAHDISVQLLNGTSHNEFVT